jgi:hypothetical protein|tara:strand:- start:5050 stop:5919 length:870 start_codon:yes stop_codon:yes gene_type:complete
MSLQELKSKRKTNFEALTKKLDQLNGNIPQQSDDDIYWKPTVDKMGNGHAIIRFLPEPKGEDDPFVRIWDHGFQGPGGWYIEKSLTTLNQKDPVSEYNSKLWNSGKEQDKDTARKQKRRLQFHANILVVKDAENPETEGKVFLYKFGKKIFDKINDMMNPQFDDEEAVNPFDFWSGANFRLKIRQVDGYRNYDKSEFDSPAPLSEDDSELEAIWEKQHSLKELVSEDKFKSYDELKARLDKVLNIQSSSASPSVAEEETPPWKEETSTPSAKEDDDDGLSFFKSLAEDD